MTLPLELTTEIQKLAPSAMIELFVMDSTSIGGEILRFHAGTNGLKQNIVWQGETYVRYPVVASGFEFNGQGQIPRPKLQVANILSAITQVTSEFGDLLGAKITRKRTLAKFLDAVNFSGGVNASADPTAEFDEDIYYIDRKSSEDRDVVEFELAASVDLVGVSVPRRQVIQNICIWKYRGAECGFTGAPIFDINDDQMTVADTAYGQAVLDAYAAIQAATVALATAETTLSAAAQLMGSVCEYQLVSRHYDDNGYVYGNGIDPAFIDGYLDEDVHPEKKAWSSSVRVTLGATYRIGPLQKSGFLWRTYSIEVWAIDTAACTSATAAYNAALADRDNKITALATANTALETALAALPSDDPLRTADRCGKRLSSCKARFGENEELSFGSFPAAGLIK
jgi:lambda family phage minor tail protein L